MKHVKEAFLTFKDNLMFFMRTEICLEVLIESGAGKTLKYFQDYCRMYQEDMPELQQFVQMVDRILQKWKNFVTNTIFDDKRDNQVEFVKCKK